MLGLLRPRTASSRSPCPHCDTPLERALAGRRRLVCPHCRRSLQPVKRASNLRRVVAATVDLAVVLLICAPWILFQARAVTGDERGLINRILDALAQGMGTNLLALWPAWLVTIIYFSSTTTLLGRTAGQQCVGLRVVDAEGLIPSAKRCSSRAIALVITNLPLGLGFLWSLIDASGRSVHDHVSKTYVIQSL